MADFDSDEEIKVRMKRPTLLRQLQTILSTYPDDAQILRELVQNAEDAGAGCMKIFYDKRNIDPGGNSTIRQYFKSPGICVYNDAMFTQIDWDGIITIYDSVKEKEPLKVGRFGLGFKSVFHMTDTPIIISGNKVLIIDPIKSEKNEDECSIIPIKSLKKRHSPRETLACILERFHFDDTVLDSGQYKGTLFWFPLRQQKSSLSSTIYSEVKARGLFTSFVKESRNNLLFLKCLEKIELYDLENDIPYFTLEMYGLYENEFGEARRSFCEELEKLGNDLPETTIRTNFEAVVKTPTTEDHYIVVSSLSGSETLSPKMKDLTSAENLHYSPYTGVAYCSKTRNNERSLGHIFCFLPLPETKRSMTGLPIHVNGFFDLEQNRRHLKEGTATGESSQTDESLLWNEGMISELLPESYHLLVTLMKEKCERESNSSELVEEFYRSIPDPDEVHPNWKSLSSALYERIIEENIFYTKQNGGKWIKHPEALFAVFGQDEMEIDRQMRLQNEQSVKRFLLDCGENLVELPNHMIQVLKLLGHDPEEITPRLVRDKLKSSQCWQSYSNDDKFRLLSFILEDENYTDLADIQLLPLNTGGFTHYSNNSAMSHVFVVSNELARLFPGLEERFVSKGAISDDIWKSLQKMTDEGLFQLRRLDNESFPDILHRTFEVNCKKNDKGQDVPQKEGMLDQSWIYEIWKEINSRDYNSLVSFENIPLIPIWQNSETGIEYIQLKGRYMLSMFEDYEELPKAIQKVLELMDVFIFSTENTMRFTHSEVIGKYIKLPTVDNMLKYFRKGSKSVSTEDTASCINESCKEEEKTDIFMYLNNHFTSIPPENFPLLKLLKIFKQSDNINDCEMVSYSENCTLVGSFEYPKELLFPKPLLMKISEQLIKHLGGHEIDQKSCISAVLDLMLADDSRYTTTDRTTLMVYLKDQSSDVVDHVLLKAKGLQFIPSSDGNIHRVKELFDPSVELLKDLFDDEDGIFPVESFVNKNGFSISFLQRLGIKSADAVNPDHLVRIASKLDETQHGSLDEKCQRKVYSLKHFLNKIQLDDRTLSDLKDLKWVPVCTQKPEDYPDALNWYTKTPLDSPAKVKSLEYKNLIGSIAPLISIERINQRVVTYYMWKQPPEQHYVVEHFQNVIDSYNPKQNSAYISIAKAVLKYITELKNDGELRQDSIEKLQSMDCILTNNKGFKPIERAVIEIDNCHINFSLEPYIFELATDLNNFRETYQVLGVKPSVEFEVLKSLLVTLSRRYEIKEDSKYNPDNVRKDRTLAVNILKAIISMGVVISQLSDVLVPINSTDDWLSFRPVEKCTYSSGNSSLSTIFDTDDNEEEGEEGEENIIYVHPDVNSIAPKLGVASVTQRFMTSQNTTVLAWGQAEKLTTRISNLLDSYTDGFAVPKELIQNADDAGAKKVCFLFDERQNMEYRESLFDKGLAECQGPALWVYNDAIFQEKDFKNIIALGGKTKILETDKIGKFGLGFCSVYNLTDVPSFVSLNKLVILDPHLHHLGEAAIGNNPGLLIPLTKSCRRNFPDQLKPYSGVFGCDLSQQASQMYNGTLFRFPLRTHKQASNNEIKNLEYSRGEMIELLLKFVEAAANLLLFTQNVEEISVYHLDSKSKYPKEEMELLFKTQKNMSNANDVHGEYRYNILKQVTNAVDDHRENDIDLPLHIVDVNMDIYNAATKLSNKFDPSSQTVTWLISWGVGEQSFDLAYDLKSQGAIPVGCIAVPVKKKNGELLRYTKMEDLQTGFYSKGRVFCFLPLPIETHLQVHINGCFMVEQDRKSLIRFNTDSKVNDGNTWNEAMLKDILQSAFINLLSSIATKINDTIMETNYWTLWPQVSENRNDESVLLLVRSLYQNILSSNYPVFYRSTDICHGVVCSLKQCIFLDPEFRNVGEIGQSAYECMVQFHHGALTVMDMPIEVYQNCQEAATEHIDNLKRRIVSKADFFKLFFFPNIKDDYWSTADMKAKRNNLTLKAFEDEQLHKLLKEYECIPVKNSCILRRPSDVVLEDGSVSDMFDNNDERFPDVAFDMYRAILLTMGMMDTRISTELLKDRIESVQMISKEDGLIRSKAVLKYLVTAIDYHMDQVHMFSNMPFLPAMEKPTDWSLPWKGSDAKEQFLAPEILFLPTVKNIVGSVVYILDTGEKNVCTEILRKIGIQSPDIEKVIAQMNILGEANLTSSLGLEHTCEQLYSLLDGYLKHKVDIFQSLQYLQKKRIIVVEDQLIQPCRVALCLPGGCCKPFLYEMPRNLQRFNMLWRSIGIPRYFEKSIFATLLQEQAQKNENNKLREDEALGIIHILKNLCISLVEHKSTIQLEERKNIFLPDENCILRCLLDVCYSEPDFDYIDESVYIIHGEITQAMIKTLGIMSTRHLYFSRFSDSIPFGQKEKLTTRLKGIIDAYPKDYSVLNELLQNADDAAATEIHFIFDQRELPSANIFDKKWQPLQGPALCVFNNACFTEEDLKGIQNLGEGSKSDDPTKTGQFGVGFNAVYHLTDVPSFLTRGQNFPGGGTYCVFDPHCSYVPAASLEAPGRRISIETLESKYNDVYKGYLQDVLQSEVGTWFRFPLRTTAMSRESDIKKTPTGNTDMEMLLSKMKAQMKKSLLFLKNIKKISISYIEKSFNNISNTVSVELSVKDTDTEKVRNFMSFVKDEAKNLKTHAKSISEIAFKEVEYTATVKDSAGNSDIWLIVQTFGFANKDKIPASIVDSYSKGELGFLPKGATAICASTISEGLSGRSRASRRLESNTTGDAFCVLPLPIQTGLPGHINGHFSLFVNRNGLFDGKFQNDERLLWNRLLINQTVADSYASCIAYAKVALLNSVRSNDIDMYLDSFFICFPNVENITNNLWKELAYSVYRRIHQRELGVFPVCAEYGHGSIDIRQNKDSKSSLRNIKWISLECDGDEFKACFDNLDSLHMSDKATGENDLYRSIQKKKENTIRQLLVDAGMKLTCAPLWIFRSICKTFSDTSESDSDTSESECDVACTLTPKNAIDFLKSWNRPSPDKCYLTEVDIPVTVSIFQSVEKLRVLLNYCLLNILKAEDFPEIKELPLLVSNDGKLLTFSSSKDIIFSEFCNLLPQSAGSFVHFSIISSLEKFRKFFRALDISTFCSFLPLSMNQKIYKQNGPVLWENTTEALPNHSWMKMFWRYL